MATKKYFQNFFDEKEINWQSWEIMSENGTWNLIDTDAVIEFIKNLDDDCQEAKQIRTTLVKIDYHNGKVEPFLKHIAEGIVKAYGNF